MTSSKKFTRNKQAKINLIYDTFFKLILKQGYHKTSTNRIAEAAKISVGTIYKYFPKGIEDIIKKYFEESMQKFLDSQDLHKMSDENIGDFLSHFILDLFNDHKENQAYNLAFRAAIQSNKTLHNIYIQKLTTFFKTKVQQLRKINDNLKRIPEKRLVDIFLFMYNLVHAILYHHLSVMELFDTDDVFVEYLSNLATFSLTYYLKT